MIGLYIVITAIIGAACYQLGSNDKKQKIKDRISDLEDENLTSQTHVDMVNAIIVELKKLL